MERAELVRKVAETVTSHATLNPLEGTVTFEETGFQETATTFEVTIAVTLANGVDDEQTETVRVTVHK